MLILLFFIAGTFADDSYASCVKLADLKTGKYHIKALPKTVVAENPTTDLFKGSPADGHEEGDPLFVPWVHYEEAAADKPEGPLVLRLSTHANSHVKPEAHHKIENTVFHVKKDKEKLEIFSKDEKFVVVATSKTNLKITSHPFEMQLAKNKGEPFIYTTDYELKYNRYALHAEEGGESQGVKKSNIYQGGPTGTNGGYKHLKVCFQNIEEKGEGFGSSRNVKPDGADTGVEGGKKELDDTKGGTEGGTKGDTDPKGDPKNLIEEETEAEVDPKGPSSIYIIQVFASVLITAFLF